MHQVSDVLADESLTVDHERDRVLQVSTNREDWTRAGKFCNRTRSVASGAAKDYGAEGAIANHRVVDSARDGALAYEKCVGNS
jgi:hypothetical protein